MYKKVIAFHHEKRIYETLDLCDYRLSQEGAIKCCICLYYIRTEKPHAIHSCG